MRLPFIQFVKFGLVGVSNTAISYVTYALLVYLGFHYLIANMVACVLDHYEWSSSRYTWKKFLTMGLLIVIPALIVFLAIFYGGTYNG